VKHSEARLDVTRHVQRMPDPEHDLAVFPAAVQSLRSILVVPVVNPVMMRAG
jgi:hypothetical protein